ncbi:hypothetical protein EYZ11_010987 [Aspergillus tanneri]|uniref:Uncharacterized protein n=1 Tax=Aspergillus tanneri TaxID=1220188 RepID=A0A4S3J3Y0_9EURO|nr:hypothetical protein EYZ11_010987 [Aspergillus tanneri]
MVGTDQSYPIHTIFFWYFKAKENPETAPLVIWMNGSPGASPMFALFTENGPCHVNPNLTTSENPWSWNQQYNVLYLDQPVQTGFSYNVPQDASQTANTTPNAARHWTESYGGRYGPGFAAYVEQQNKHIDEGLLPVNLTTLGIINSCVDLLTQISSRPEFVYGRNAYSIPGLTRQNFRDCWTQI